VSEDLARDLAALTGEELYRLASAMTRALAAAAAVQALQLTDYADLAGRAKLVSDLGDVLDDVLLQFARIPVSMATAHVMVRTARARYNRLVPVQGTS
jgi:hypothetical protein